MYSQRESASGAFSVITNLRMELFEALITITITRSLPPVLLGAVELVLHLIAGGAHIRLLAISENINYHRIKR